jgi:MoaA/NifB/PqqE/SkfB family radical SAM enzyme
MVNISPTENCNLKCIGCYAAGYSRNREMTLEEIEYIILQAKKLGIYFIGFLGGEPFLRRDLFKVIERHKDVAFRISTNGTILDGQILDALKHCGNLVVFISLEGFEDDTDTWRGPGVYSKILKTMATLKQEQILFGFSLLVHKQNFAIVTSEQFLDAMQDAGCKFGLFFPYGPAGDNARYDLTLTKEQIEILFTKITNLDDKYTMLMLKEGYLAPSHAKNNFLQQGCRAGVTIHITPEGYVEPCNGIQFFTENVFDKGLGQIFRSPFYMDIFSCVQRNGKHCIAIFEPKEVIEIIKKHGAMGSNPCAFPTYKKYAECFPESPLMPSLEKVDSKENIL